MALKEYKSETFHFWRDDRGRIQGEYKVWHDVGILSIHGNFVDGAYNGEYKEWHQNGKLKIHCYYKGNKVHGEYKTWDMHGQLCKHILCLDGQIINNEPDKLTNKDKFELTLRYSIQWL